MAVIILIRIYNLLLLIRIWQLVVPSRTGLSLWWDRFSFPIFSLRIPKAWPFRIRKVETGSCLLEVLSTRLDIVVLLTLNAGSSHSTYLSHLLFILVENVHLIFIILFHKEHFLVLLIIRWWHCLMRTSLTILLDKHGRVDVVNRTHFILANVFSWVTIFVEVQISEILSRVAARLDLISTLRCRQLVIVTISKILTVAHI